MSKKMDSFWAIIQHSSGAAALELPPTPGLESTKEVPLTANEIAMCTRIAHIYTKEKLSKKQIKNLLIEAGIATGGALGGAYLAGKVGKVAVKEVLNFIPFVGWGIKAIVGGSLTFSIGWLFLKFCEIRFT